MERVLRQQYTREFREHAVQLILEQQVPILEAAPAPPRPSSVCAAEATAIRLDRTAVPPSYGSQPIPLGATAHKSGDTPSAACSRSVSRRYFADN